MRNNNVLNLRRSLPCMSWSPKNLYNLWKRTAGPAAEELTFKLTTQQTVFQQRWRSKAAVRAYHGDFIPEKVFKRWYLPQNIPDVRPKRQVFSGGDKLDLEEFARRKLRAKQKEQELEDEIEQKGMAPVGSLMFVEVERRLDVFLFRTCFVHSVYEARRLIIHGYVKLNGRKHSKANTRLAPGDMISVDPEAIRFFNKPPPHVLYDDVINGNRVEPKVTKDAPDNVEVAAEETSEVPAEVAQAAVEETSNASTEAAPEVAKEKPKETKKAAQQTSKDNKGSGGKKSHIVEASKKDLTPFYLPAYASPWLFIPAYIEVSFKTCSAVYVRHPTARPGYSEIPTPYDADGALIRYAWEWYNQRRPRMRSQSQLARSPEDRVVTVAQALHKDWTRTLDPGWTLAPHKDTPENIAAYKERQWKREAVASAN
ncbi:hypothetical protein D9619_010489 [Psilocybe cf. subviscida]|uniref:RNA-binding S4 domain-containing protein n=1 Tax=Psilocybe cf. subviscida TaxID=2480587 RepID=A0A8H5ERV9_9AGAR|nr:hypothetical protein D9619_010489 [Psilocybe cf. subviscida]